jgi:Protein of unknown function (DUF3533)
MLNWVGMLSVYVDYSPPCPKQPLTYYPHTSGLALESLITLLTVKFIPFFMILWIIGEALTYFAYMTAIITSPAVNVSIPIFPIEVLPLVFRYGYATPFYNISHAMRCILFGTKNTRSSHVHSPNIRFPSHHVLSYYSRPQLRYLNSLGRYFVYYAAVDPVDCAAEGYNCGTGTSAAGDCLGSATRQEDGEESNWRSITIKFE